LIGRERIRPPGVDVGHRGTFLEGGTANNKNYHIVEAGTK